MGLERNSIDPHRLRSRDSSRDTIRGHEENAYFQRTALKCPSPFSYLCRQPLFGHRTSKREEKSIEERKGGLKPGQSSRGRSDGFGFHGRTRSVLIGCHSDKRRLIIGAASCVSTFSFAPLLRSTPVNNLPDYLKLPFPGSPRNFRRTGASPAPGSVGSADGRTDGRARDRQRHETRWAPRRCASRRITIRTGTPSSVRETSATLRHPGPPLALSHRPSDIHVREPSRRTRLCAARTCACVARACACTRVQHGTEYPYQRGDAIPATVLQRRTSRAHTQGVGREGERVYDRVRERIGDRLPPPTATVVTTTTATTTAGTSTRFPSFSRQPAPDHPSSTHFSNPAMSLTLSPLPPLPLFCSLSLSLSLSLSASLGFFFSSSFLSFFFLVLRLRGGVSVCAT